MTTELRLALAMRGGVSLAVWIGGAVSEIDLARRASPDGDDFWSTILRDAAGYDRVVVDVLAGASAGGLNGVLYAASQVYDFPYDRMRDVWLEVGGIDGLVRRGPPWPSLLQGDDYFLTTVYEKLVELTSRPPVGATLGGGPEPPRPRVELALSATVMEPIVRPLPSPKDEPLFQRRHGSGFRFRQPEERWLPTDFPAATDDRFGDALWRLAIAARSTSSFPVAFEGAEVRSSRRTTFTSPPAAAGTATGAGVELDGTFLDRTNGEPFIVADGGILDNIPIQCALDVVANAPAERRTERFLVYLQPGASTASVAPGVMAEDERRTTLAVLRGVVAARVAGETINTDIAAIEAYNEGIERARNLRRATFADLTGRPPFLAAAAAGLAHYRRSRASHEASEIFRLLLDPVGVLGEDQFPQEVAGTPVADEDWRSPIARWPQHDREGLETALGRRLHASTGRAGTSLLAASGELGPLLRVNDLLIEWARWLEGATDHLAPGQAKISLYRIRTFLGSVLDRSRQLAWVSAAASRRSDPAGFVAAAMDSFDQMALVDPALADATIEALRDGATAPLEAACQQAIARVDQVVAGMSAEVAAGSSDPGAPEELLARIAALLVDVVAPLADLAVPAPADDDHEPGRLLHRVLGTTPVTVEVLEGLEVLCLPEFVSGLPGRRRVDFRRLSTANRTPLARHFAALMDAAGETGQWWDPAAGPEAQKGIHVALKLAGNELANFSAFLLAQWRANDWLWGRLDAVPTLIDLLIRPRRLAERLAECPGEAEALEFVHELVAPSSHPWRARLDGLVWTPALDDVRMEVRFLRASPEAYRDDLETSAIRDALVARRQWEILGQEMSLPKEPMGTVPGTDPGRPPTLEEVEAWVAGYGVGAETIRGNERAPELLDRFNELATAATETALHNASLPSSRLPRPPRIVATAIRRLGPRLGRRLARGLVVVPTAAEASRRNVLLGLAVAALLVLGVLGWYVDKWAFVLGFVVSFLPLGALVLVLHRTAVKLLGPERPPPRQPQH